MKTYKHKFLAITLLFTTIVFAQKQEKKVSETFKVSDGVLVDISTRHTDVTIETWNNNSVSVEGIWEVGGLNKEESNELFESIDFEALGNKEKVVITARTKTNHVSYSGIFDNINLDFDFDSIFYSGNLFAGNFHFDFDSIVNLGDVIVHDFHFEAPEVPEMPEMPEKVISHLSKIEFNYKAYENDKEGYIKDFIKRQEALGKEMKEKIEPHLKEFEKKMHTWEKDNESKMKEFEKKMSKWVKDNEPRMKKFEEKMKKMGEEMEKKYKAILEDKHKNNEEKSKIKKTLLIKIPKTAKVKLDVRYGSFNAPKDLKIVD